LVSTGRVEASVACPGSQEAWLNTWENLLHANTGMRMAA